MGARVRNKDRAVIERLAASQKGNTMFPISRKAFISKVLVPVLNGCDQGSAILAAHAIAGNQNVLLTGFIHVPADQSLSTAAVSARELRKTLQKLYKVKRSDEWAQVNVSHKPWNELVKVIKREDIDLLLLERSE